MHERTAMGHRRSSGEVRPYVRSSKPRFNWTGELKLLFEEAMTVLGGTRKATPKQIRELMKCPHIQLSHIKSRLQMCRIRMEEKERRPGSNSSEEHQLSRRRGTADYIDPNGDEHSVVVDDNESSEAALSLSMPCSSLEYQSQHHFFHPSPQSRQRPFKRVRLGQMNPSASDCQSPQRICDAGAFKFQYYFDYFGSSQVCSAVVAEYSTFDFFREEQTNVIQKLVQRLEDDEKEEQELQLSLSLSMPCKSKSINLDLSL